MYSKLFENLSAQIVAVKKTFIVTFKHLQYNNILTAVPFAYDIHIAPSTLSPLTNEFIY